MDCIGDGDGAPNGVGAAGPPNGDADDNPPVEPNGLLLPVLDAALPNGDGAGAEELPNGDGFVCVFEAPNGDGLDDWNMLDFDDALSPVLVPKGDGLGAVFPNGEDDAGCFCCVAVPDDEPKGLAPIFCPEFPKPGVGVAADGVDASLPNPEDENPLGVAVEVDWLDDSCKGFGTLYLFASF